MIRRTFVCLSAAVAVLCMACGGSKNTTDAGTQSCTVGSATYPINCTYDPGFTQTSPNTPNTIGVTFSGETLAINGLPYVPVTAGDPYFVDGWSIQFDEYLFVVGNIRLNANPTEDSTWTDMGPEVAHDGRTFVFDAHHAQGFLGKDGVEPANGLFLWTQLDTGAAFDTSARYGFSYDVQQAKYPAVNVNLPLSELADYDLMVQKGWSKMLRGTATFVAGGGYTPSASIQSKFAALPTTIHFAMGWDDHGALIDCVNTDNGDHGQDNLANRGVQTNNNGTYIAQITVHVDHLFWDALEHEGEPLRFDPIAAWAPQGTTVANPFWINDLSSGANHQQLSAVFQDGTPLPDRGPYLTGNGIAFTSDMSGSQVIMNTAGVTTTPANSYPDFMAFSVQSQSHLNAQGLCYVVGQHPNDPYYQPSVAAYP